MTSRAGVEGDRWTPSRRLTASPEWPHDFFAEAADMLCVAGVDGYFKALNPAWTRILGYSQEELLSRPYLDFVHPDDRAMTAAEASKIGNGVPATHFRNRYRCVDGSYRWLSWTATAALLDGAIYASARDVTTAVEADEEGARQQREVVERASRVHTVLAGSEPHIVLQPIFALQTGMVHGFEALSRFRAPPERSPDAWFAEAASVGLGPELETRAVANAAALAQHLPATVFLSINVSPATLTCADLDAALAPVSCDHLVLEITEHATVADGALLKSVLKRMRERGVRLAIDDAGAGYSGLMQIVQLLPEFIKLDLFLTRGIDSDPVKRALAAALVRFASDVGASLIAEGVETAEELRALEELGIEYAQGFFLGRPLPMPATPLPPAAAPDRWLHGLPRVLERENRVD
jgi:PAS domain S-box-containing protein